MPRQTSGGKTFVQALLRGLAVDFAQDRIGQGLGRAVKDDPAGGHADDPAAIGAGGVQGMQVGQNRDAVAAVDVGQRVHHQLGVQRVQRCDRLIRKHDPRLLHQRPGDGDALLLAAGEGVGAVHGDVRHAQADPAP